MAEIFRVYKQNNFTVMSNHHLQNTNLSLKAMGLLSKILSLPDDWNINIRGMAAICKDGRDSIQAAFKELIAEGYVLRQQLRDPNGKLNGVEYIIRESPDVDIPNEFMKEEVGNISDVSEEPLQDDTVKNAGQVEVVAGDEKILKNNGMEPCPDSPCTDFPDTVNPDTGNPCTEKPDTGNPPQLNTKELNIKQQNTNKPNIIPPPPTSSSTEGLEMVEECVKQRVGYSALLADNDRKDVDAIVRLLARYESGLGQYAYIDGKKIPAEEIKKQFQRLCPEDIERVLCSAASADIKNMNNYLVSALYRTVLRSAMEKPKPTQIYKNKNRFNNFHQRDYDFDELEKLLNSKTFSSSI